MSKNYNLTGIGSSVELGKGGSTVVDTAGALDINSAAGDISITAASGQNINIVTSGGGNLQQNGVTANLFNNTSLAGYLAAAGIALVAADDEDLSLATGGTGAVTLGTTGSGLVTVGSTTGDVSVSAGGTATVDGDITLIDSTTSTTIDSSTATIVQSSGTTTLSGATSVTISSTNDVNLTAGGNITVNADPTTALGIATKQYVDGLVASNIVLKGEYNPVTDTPDIVATPSQVSAGDMYVISAAGTFYGSNVEVGDTIIATVDNADSAGEWTIIQSNLDAASIKTLYESNPDTNAYTDADETKVGFISVTQAVDLDTMESDIATNNAKVSNVTTNLTTAYTATTVTVESSDGTNATVNQVVAGGNAGVMSGADKTKLDGIEALADVTDAVNVAAAGATMNADTDVSTNGWVLDEDDMSSDDATKVPTQQSVKAYVDSQVGGAAGVSAVTVDFDETDAGTFNIGASLPLGAIVTSCKVLIDSAFNGTTTTLTIGNTAGASDIMTDSENDAVSADLYVTSNLYKVDAANKQQLFGTLALGDATTGSGTVLIEYYIA